MDRTIIILAFSLTFLINLWGDYKQNKKLKCLTKPLLMPLIIVYYLLSAAAPDYLLIAALLMGFIGDVFLLGTGSSLIYGAIAFLIGHFCYIFLFVQSTSFFATVPLYYALFLIPYIIYAIFFICTIKNKVGYLIIPISVYICTILTMSFCALCRISPGLEPANLLPWAGSILFIASDSILGGNTYLCPQKNYEVSVMITYVLAQLFIMAGFII